MIKLYFFICYENDVVNKKAALNDCFLISY